LEEGLLIPFYLKPNFNTRRGGLRLSL
jgi:hypothetical protein